MRDLPMVSVPKEGKGLGGNPDLEDGVRLGIDAGIGRERIHTYVPGTSFEPCDAEWHTGTPDLPVDPRKYPHFGKYKGCNFKAHIAKVIPKISHHE